MGICLLLGYPQILAHNNLIGRIIGKGGATIKKVMEETATKITVSSISDINAFKVERIITIAAPEVENVSRAEAEISSKLRKAYEHDVQEVVVSVQGSAKRRVPGFVNAAGKPR